MGLITLFWQDTAKLTEQGKRGNVSQAQSGLTYGPERHVKRKHLRGEGP